MGAGFCKILLKKLAISQTFYGKKVMEKTETIARRRVSSFLMLIGNRMQKKKDMNTFSTIYHRKSVRSYTGVPVTDAQLEKILLAANAAPVGRGEYDSVFLTIITNTDLLRAIDTAAAEYFQNPDLHPLYGAPTLILVSTKLTGTPADNVSYSNAAMIVHNMALESVDLNVGSCCIWGAAMALQQRPDVLQYLQLPENFVPVCGLIVGQTDEIYEEREIPKNRIGKTVLW